MKKFDLDVLGVVLSGVVILIFAILSTIESLCSYKFAFEIVVSVAMAFFMTLMSVKLFKNWINN